MTITIKNDLIYDLNGNECYIYIEQDKYESGYKVGFCTARSVGIYHKENEHYYPTITQAKRRYNYLKCKIKKEKG